VDIRGEATRSEGEDGRETSQTRSETKPRGPIDRTGRFGGHCKIPSIIRKLPAPQEIPPQQNQGYSFRNPEIRIANRRIADRKGLKNLTFRVFCDLQSCDLQFLTSKNLQIRKLYPKTRPNEPNRPPRSLNSVGPPRVYPKRTQSTPKWVRFVKNAKRSHWDRER